MEPPETNNKEICVFGLQKAGRSKRIIADRDWRSPALERAQNHAKEQKSSIVAPAAIFLSIRA
jgi:hypothetical protein